VSPTRYELNYAARIALARSVELEQQLAVAEAERERLLSAIRNHRAQKGFSGGITGSDRRLWDAAGFGDDGWADIKGDL
jgi:hypothetical protein